jgi:hypothetical protein
MYRHDLMMLSPENHRDEVWMSDAALDIDPYSIQNQSYCLTKVWHVIAVKGFFSTQAEKSRMLLLLIGCIAILLAFWSRFPREASTRPMEPVMVETYFNTGWENDSAGGFVWVLNEKNKFIIANSENIKKSGYLGIQIAGAPCGGSHEVMITSKSLIPERISVNANQKSEVQIQLTLDPYARVPVFVNVSGKGCSSSATDGRLIKVQVRQPIFVLN